MNIHNGRIKIKKPSSDMYTYMLIVCGELCNCPSSCPNRIADTSHRLELFRKDLDSGFSIRTMNSIQIVMAHTLRQTFFSIMARTLWSEPHPPPPDLAFVREFYKNMEIAYGQTPFVLTHIQVTDEMLHHWIPKLVDILNDTLRLGDPKQETHVVEIFVGVGDMNEFYKYHKDVHGWNSTKMEENVVVFKKVILYVLEEVIKADPEQQLMYYWDIPPSAVLKLIKQYLYVLYPDQLGPPPTEPSKESPPPILQPGPSILKHPEDKRTSKTKMRVSWIDGRNQISDLVPHPPHSPDEPTHAAAPTKFPFIAEDAIENHLPTPQEQDDMFMRDDSMENGASAESKPRERLALPEEETTPAARNTDDQLNHLPRVSVNHELPATSENVVPVESPNKGAFFNQSNWFNYEIPFLDDCHDSTDSEDEDEAPGLSRPLRAQHAPPSARSAAELDLHTVHNNKNTLRVEPDAVKLEPFVLPETLSLKNHNKDNLKRASSDDWVNVDVSPSKLKTPNATTLCSPKKMLPEEDWLQKRDQTEPPKRLLRDNKTELGLFIDPALGPFHDLPIEPQYRFVKMKTLHPSSDDCHTVIYLVRDKEWLLYQDLPVGPKMVMIVFDDKEKMNGKVKKVPGHKVPDALVMDALRVMVYEISKRHIAEMKEELKEEEDEPEMPRKKEKAHYGAEIQMKCHEMSRKKEEANIGAESTQKKRYDHDLDMEMAKEEEEEVIRPKKVHFDKKNSTEKNMVKQKLNGSLLHLLKRSLIVETPTKPHFELAAIAKDDYNQVKLGLYIDPSLGFFSDLPIQPNFRFARTCTLYPPTRSCYSMIYFVKDKDALIGRELPEGITMMMIVFDEEMKAQVRKVPRHMAPEPVVIDALRLMVHDMNRRKSARMEESKNGWKSRRTSIA